MSADVMKLLALLDSVGALIADMHEAGHSTAGLFAAQDEVHARLGMIYADGLRRGLAVEEHPT